MATNYSKVHSRVGAAIGTIISVPKDSTWTNSTNPTTEGSNWQLDDNYPGWLPCEGQSLSKSDYRALYQVVGDTYGSTTTNFSLPDYRSKKLVGTGSVDGNQPGGLTLTPTSGPGNSLAEPNTAGSEGGVYSVTTVRQLPPSSEITPGSPSTPETIGGGATDTFNISTFTTDGFGQVTTVVNSDISGTVNWSAGATNTGTQAFPTPIPGPHYHEIRYAQRGNTQAAAGNPYASAQDVGFMNQVEAGVLSYTRFGESLRKHSHMLNWGYGTTYAGYGNDEAGGSSGLVNRTEIGGNINQKFGDSFNPDNNRGNVINKTVGISNNTGDTLGVFFNVGTFTLSNAAKSQWDAALDMRLQSAEELPVMQPYFRLKYLIKAY